MIISDLSQIPTNLRQVIEQNPFSQQLTALKNDLSSYQDYLNDATVNVRNYQQAVINEKVNRQTYTSKLQNVRKQLNVLQKSADAAVLDFSCEFLKPDRVEKFFDSIGMKFISFSFSRNGDDGYLRFVRPAKMIGCLPVQPFVCRIRYKLVNGVLMFKNANCYYGIATRNNNNIHPHVSSGGEGSVCLGNYIDILSEQEVPLVMESYQDHVILLDQLLSTYNPDSPFRRLDEIIMDAVNHELRFTGMDVAVDDDSRATTIVHSKLNQTRSVYGVRDLVTREGYEVYYEMMRQVKLIDIIDDIEANVQMVSYDDDSSECYEYACRVHKAISAIFKDQSFSSVDDFAEYDDDGDYYRLYESQLDDLKDSWIDTLKELRESDDFADLKLEFKGMESLDKVFPLPTLQQAVSASSEAVEPRQEIPMPQEYNPRYPTPMPAPTETSDSFTF